MALRFYDDDVPKSNWPVTAITIQNTLQATTPRATVATTLAAADWPAASTESLVATGATPKEIR